MSRKPQSWRLRATLAEARLREVEEERDEARKRCGWVDSDACGGGGADYVDELESASGFLKADIQTLRSQLAEARTALARIYNLGGEAALIAHAALHPAVTQASHAAAEPRS